MFFPEISPRFADIVTPLKEKPIAVLGHLRPDGDCIGSQVALARVLNAQGFDAVCINKHPSPRALLGFIADTPYLEAHAFTEHNRIPIACDAADRERLGDELNSIYKEIYLCIDHHISNSGYAKHNLIDPTTAATAEILAGIFFDLDYPVDPVAAQALYIGIATDTGQFQYEATTRRVFEISGRLLDCGANPHAASIALYEQETFSRIKLLQRYLSTLTMELEDRVCLGTLTAEDYQVTGATYEDTEGFVNYARSLATTEIGAILEERGNTLKGSLRAKDPIMRVDQLALTIGGGGHACAAGFSVKGETIATYRDTFLKLVCEHLQKIQ